MDEIVRYDELKSEKTARENELCRTLVREISLLGMTQRQMVLITYLLALELENVEQMQAITAVIRETADSSVFLIDQAKESS